MRRLATGLVCAGAFGFLAMFIGAGCSAQGSTEDGPLPETDSAPTDPGVKLPPPSTSGGGGTSGTSGSAQGDDDDTGGPVGDGGSTGPKKDSGTSGSTVDSGPQLPKPVPGQPCPTLDEKRTVSCGFCGTQTAICETKDGAQKWSDYNACEGMPSDAVCVAGTVENEPCGNCGTRPRTCSNKCIWTTGACTVPPAAVCSPTTLDLTNAGCDEPTYGPYVYRVRSCKADCSFNPYSSCISPPATLDVGPTVGTVSSTIAILNGSLAKIASGVCPVTAAFGEGRAYAYTQIHNPAAKDVTVTIYNSTAPGGVAIKTVLAAYKGDQAPLTADARKECLKSSTSTNATVTGGPGFAILEGTKKVVIPAGGDVMLYTSASDANVSGSVKVNVKTESFAATP